LDKEGGEEEKACRKQGLRVTQVPQGAIPPNVNKSHNPRALELEATLEIIQSTDKKI
jgi:hypothetical protein